MYHKVMFLLLICGVGIADARSLVQSQSLSMPSSSNPKAPDIFQVIAAACIAGVYVAAICASKKKPRTETDDDFLARDRAATVGMEGNPLYKPVGATASVDELAARQVQAQRQQRQANGDQDEDEDAMADRRTTMSSAPARKTMNLGNGAPIWLHMGMTKRESIDVLNSDPAPESGMFLIRAKARVAGQYVLDLGVVENGALVLEHYAILRSTATNEFLINDRTSKTGARTVEALVSELHGSTNLIRCSLVRGVGVRGEGAGQQRHAPAARRGSEVTAGDLSLRADANNA